jgi:hypothetical protein
MASVPHAQANGDWIEDARLSWAARGVLGYMIAHEMVDRVDPKTLIAAGPLGRDGVYAILRELRRYGYLEIVKARPRMADGKWRMLRKTILERDHRTCRYCCAVATHVDHVYPHSRGGSDDPSNLVACCKRCSDTKGDRTPEEWGVDLLPEPPLEPQTP